MEGLQLRQAPCSRSFLKLTAMEVKWIHVLVILLFLLSVAMTGCFLWQYSLPKVEPGPSVMEVRSEAVQMCPRYPEPVPLDHPLPILKEALEKVDQMLRQKMHSSGLPAMSAIVIYNDTVLWTGNFGKKNGSDPTSGLPNEYTIYRTMELFGLEGTTQGGSNPPPGSRSLPRRLRSTSLLWKGNTQDALALLKDDVLVADPGTRCHYSNLAFSLMAHVLADHAADGQYQRWVSENILDRLGMEDTGFDITAPIRSQMAVGFYGSQQPAPLYDLGWYRPSGQMYSTAADLAKLAMVFLGTYHRRLLEPDTVKTMLTPLLKCSTEYFANKTGTPWEINEQLGYDVVRKDGDLDGYSATFSLIPKLRLSFIVLMAGPRPQGGDIVTQTYEYLIPAMETAFREADKSLVPPPNPIPYVGYYTYSNLTFYEIKVGIGGVLVMQQFGPHVEELIPEKYRTIKLHHLEDRVFQVVFDKEFPCVLHLGSASISLETQNGQLFNFYPFDRKGLSPGFDAPGLNTYNVVRVLRKPVFYS
ncbi:putative beta-lactamase-like 1 [Parus major]|uniref:putative beta-lactamase-like 1 n=1 Tax=Parus major TaxID=9157 RepID=UPI0014443FCE|nr:putative beta-lactamase-like 1 [Parus major]